MMKMCNEMMGTIGMDGMMQKGMGMMQNCMGMMGGKGDDTPDDAASGDVAEMEQTETKAPAKKK